MGRRRATLLSLAALAGILALPASSQAQITRGAISGTARDASGAAVPGVVVTVTNQDTNISRSAVTDAQGFYRVPALEPGRYLVKAQLSGFQTTEYKDIRLVASSEVTLNPELKIAKVGEAITVVGEAGAVELNKTSPTVGTTTMARQVVELPLPGGRNVNNLIATSPNVSRSDGQGTYVANGQRSRNNNYMVDGSDNNDIAVTISTSPIVPEAVAEFQVQTNSYSVEFGRNSGAQVNIITRSGTNAFRGEAWDYFQTASLFSLTNLQKDQKLTKPPGFTRHQAGLTVGGPIVKDRTFFFLMYQYDPQRPDSSPGATVRTLTPNGFAALQGVPLRAGQPAASRQAVLDRLSFLNDIYAQNPSFRNLQTTLVNGVPIETGQTNVNIIQPSTYHYFMARVDHKLTDRDNLTARWYYTKRLDETQISNCAFGALFCGSQDLKDTNLALSETHMFGSSLVNEFRFSLVKRDLKFPENDPKSPTASISGLFTIGGNSNFPQSRVTDAYQFSDTATWTTGRHTFKFGADVRYNKAYNQSDFDSKGTFTFNNLQDYMNNTAFSLAQALQTASWDARQWQTFFYAQDDFRPTSDLTLNLGLRYELSTVPFGMFGATDSQSLAAMVPGPVQKDTNNWAPRVGFNWSPRSGNSLLGDGKTVFRGGFGMGYDILFYNLLTVNGSNFPRVNTATLFNVVDAYPSLLQAGGSPVFNPLNSWTNSEADTQNPDVKYWSFSVGRELGEFLFEVGYTGSRSGHGINQIVANPAILTPDQIALVLSSKNANAIPGVQARRLFPQFGARTLIPAYVGPGGNDVEARSRYNGVYFSVNKRLRHGVQLSANYTYSKFESNNDASLGEGGTGASSQRPQSMFDYGAEWSVSNFDRPHRLVVSYLWEVPGPKDGVLGKVLGGWQFSGITAYQSGSPFTILTGVDTSGDANTGSDRPNRGTGTLTWDGNHKTFTNNGYAVVPLGTNNLPLANSLGNGTLGRNTERAAGYWNTDLSLLKRVPFGRREVVLRIDALNVFNQDNYGVPVNSMSNTAFGTNTNNWGQRLFTLGAKFAW